MINLETTAEERTEWRDMAMGAYGAIARPPVTIAPDSSVRLIDDVETLLALVEARSPLPEEVEAMIRRLEAGYSLDRDNQKLVRQEAAALLRCWPRAATLSADWTAVADRIVRDVCELPDRTSPDDQPEMMLVTGKELHAIVLAALRRLKENVPS